MVRVEGKCLREQFPCREKVSKPFPLEYNFQIWPKNPFFLITPPGLCFGEEIIFFFLSERVYAVVDEKWRQGMKKQDPVLYKEGRYHGCYGAIHQQVINRHFAIGKGIRPLKGQEFLWTRTFLACPTYQSYSYSIQGGYQHADCSKSY
ncbi:hypothetical protein CAEBREN_04984 [Caenorhabditis brenneri]|uniref:Uncharacterized protein n=1 Tax=Caenorhabditis brenneri TaxID=135651 RepID=G0P3L8_CAEBE|nr:hypothetical protein CAEBREN_04984 [Caenorhabditis brenneri]